MIAIIHLAYGDFSVRKIVKSESLLFIESSRSRTKLLLAPVVASFSLDGQLKAVHSKKNCTAIWFSRSLIAHFLVGWESRFGT